MDPRATAAPRAHGWALIAMLVLAATVVLDGLLDAGVIKGATLGLVAAVALVPVLALSGRDAAAAWFSSAGGRLLVLVMAPALVGALAHLDEAPVSDRLLGFGLAHVAACLGLLAAERRRSLLALGVVLACTLAALVAWAQAFGWETTLTPGPDDVVALSGNTMRAGALLALGAVTLATLLLRHGLTARGAPEATRDPEPHDPTRWPPWVLVVLLVVVAGAMLLTRARGARYAALAGLAVVSLASRGVSPARAYRRLGLGLALAVALAGAVGGSEALQGRKLDDSAPILSGRDPTTGVRLSLARATLSLVSEQPLLGTGLGGFQREFPAHREAAEAALPGLAGAITEAEHPHNELLLATAEGGLVAGLALGLLLALGLARAWRLDREGEGGMAVTLGLVVTGVALALAQDVLTDPATAAPLFAALGFAWWPSPREDRAWRQAGRKAALAATLGGLGLGLLAWPRLDSHLSLRSFYLETEATGRVTDRGFSLLERAAEVGAGDVDVQRVAADFARVRAATAAEPAARAQAVLLVERSRERVRRLAPHQP